MLGSPHYLSPEQIQGEELDGRSDIFSLGVVLYEMLSGKRPFEGDTITTLVYQILHKEPPPISELRAVPPRLETLMRRMLAKDPADRLATAGEAARELAVMEAELSDETLSAPAGLMDETFVFPRKPSTGAPVTGLPGPPPFLSGGRPRAARCRRRRPPRLASPLGRRRFVSSSSRSLPLPSSRPVSWNTGVADQDPAPGPGRRAGLRPGDDRDRARRRPADAGGGGSLEPGTPTRTG